MRQYHWLVNITKREYVHPHQIRNGLRLREQVGWDMSTSTALVMLLAASNGRGGGDFRSKHPLVGRWAGDQIAFIGDYCEATDIPGVFATEILRDVLSDPPRGWKNISAGVREMLEEEFPGKTVNRWDI